MRLRNSYSLALAVAFAGAALVAGTDARAAGKDRKEKRVCAIAAGAFRSAQQAELSNRLREARQWLEACASAGQVVCPDLAAKCTSEYNDLAAEIPSIVPLATDEAGAPLVDVQVKMDGQLLVSQLDGRALSVDPGIHEFSFAASGNVFATEKVMIVEGQRFRPVSVVMRAAKASNPADAPLPAGWSLESRSNSKPEVSTPAKTEEPPAPETPASPRPAPSPAAAGAPASERASGPSALSFALGGAGLAAVGAGALLTYWGARDNALLARCSPNCPAGSVDHIRMMYIASDISMGAGLAAVGVATWLFFATPHRAERRAPPRTAYAFDVHPTPAGAYATVAGAF